MDHVRLPASSPDPLGEILHLLRLTGELYCQARLTAPWGIEVPELDGCLTFQVVTAGRFLLEVRGVEPRWLERGSVVVVPHGRSYRARSDRRTRVVPLAKLPVVAMTDRYEQLDFGGGGAATHVTQGVLRFDRLAARRLLDQLPPLVHIDSFAGENDGTWLREVVRAITREATSSRVGGEAMVTRLADILVIEVIRAWLESASEARSGWIAALRDDRIGRALASLHRAPGHPWDLRALAKVAGMSRAGFSARFSSLVGESTMQYVTQLRMQLARVHLQETSDSIAQTAHRFGYATEAAFCKAFKRTLGVRPSSVRSTALLAKRASGGRTSITSRDG